MIYASANRRIISHTLQSQGVWRAILAILISHPGSFIAVATIAKLSKDSAAVCLSSRSPFGRALYAFSNARARGTVCDYGGPILAETDGPGGPLVAGDHLFRDRLTGKKLGRLNQQHNAHVAYAGPLYM